jgi:hypothetical protein
MIWLLHIALSTLAWSAPLQISGQIFKQGEKILLHFDQQNSQNSKPVKGATFNVASILQNLDSGDWITGNAELINADLWLITSVDFVGLQKILGNWQALAPEGLVYSFRSFNQVSIRQKHSLQNNLFDSSGLLSYSIAPIDGKVWKFFLAQENSVRLANITFEGNRLILEYIEPQLGTSKILTFVRAQ